MNRSKRMKRISAIFYVAMFALLATSCGKNCRCWRYDGGVDDFDIDDLPGEYSNCEDVEKLNFGLTYSLCERTH